jgi:hypothetical protein
MDGRSSLTRSAILLITALCWCCGDAGVEPEQLEPPWVSGIPFWISYGQGGENVPHDDRIYESRNFLTFSDASSDEVKVLYSQIAEQALAEIMEAFEVDSSEELGVLEHDRSTKITIYSDRYLEHANLAFNRGFLLIAMDSPIASQFFGGDSARFQAWYRRDVKHETMHVMQWLLGLDWEPSWPWPARVGRTWPEFWFSEGMSEYMSGGAFPVMESMAQVNAWRQQADHVNPISVVRSTDAPVPDSRIGEYYPMFGLAVRYLLDEDGLGRSVLDVKELYLDMQTTVDFRESFERVMGLSVEDYEDQFYERVAEILP